MSQDTLNTVLAGIAAFGGVAAAIATGFAIYIAVLHNRERRRDREEDRQISEEQLRLAREQAEMRPHLEASFDLDKSSSDPELDDDALWILAVEIANTGKTTAHNVHGWVYFEAQKLAPYVPPPVAPPSEDYRRVQYILDTPRPSKSPTWGTIFDRDQEPDEEGFYEAQIYDEEKLPGTIRTFELRVTSRSEEDIRVRYRLACDEANYDKETTTVSPTEQQTNDERG